MQWKKGEEWEKERKEAMENICLLQSNKHEGKNYLIDITRSDRNRNEIDLL